MQNVEMKCNVLRVISGQYSVKLSRLLVHHSLNSSSVGGVGDEFREFFVHGLLGEFEDVIKLVPESFFVRLSRSVRLERNSTEADGVKNAEGSLVAGVVIKVIELSSSGHNVEGVRRMSGHANPFVGDIVIFLRDGSVSHSFSNDLLHLVLTVVLPDTSPMRLVDSGSIVLVRESEVLHLDDLRSELGKSLVLSSELGSSFFSGSVHAENNLRFLISVGERVEDFISLGLRVGVLEHMSTVSVPSRLGLLVVEESGGESLSELLESEPLKRVGLLTAFTTLHGGPFGVEIVHSVIPGSSGVSIILPSVLLLGGSPVRDGETLEESTGLSVESDVTDTLEHGVGVEVLSVQMEHNIRFLVELVSINVLDAEASITSLLDVETIGNKEEIRMNELDGLRSELFNPVAGGENEFNPALITTISNVVLNGSSDHTFAEQATIDELVQDALFHWHVSTTQYLLY